MGGKPLNAHGFHDEASNLLTLGAQAQRGLQYLGLSHSVRLSVCVSVESHLTYGASVRPKNAVTYSAGDEGRKICGDLNAFKSCAAKHEPKSQYANYSDLSAVSFLRLTHSAYLLSFLFSLLSPL